MDPTPPRLAARMFPLDAAFWYAEAAAPAVRPFVAGLFMLDRAPDGPRFRAAVAALTEQVARLRQRVVEPTGFFDLPRWEDDPTFDLDYHLREIVLPPPATMEQLYAYVSGVFSAPLDHLRPLWEGHLIEGIEGGRAAYFFKAHHSVMDGIGSVPLFDVFTQARREHAAPEQHREHPHPPPATAPEPAVLDILRTRVAAALRALGDPFGTARGVTAMARGLQTIAQDFRVPLTDDPLSVRSTGIGRRLDGSTFTMARMHDLRRGLDAPLNDIVLTAVAGAVARYYARHGITFVDPHCMVPMNLRRESERHALGNRVGAFNVRLPVTEPDAMERLAQIRAQTQVSKSVRHSNVYRWAMQLIPVLPSAAFRYVAESMRGRVQLICSNIPGPTTHRYVGGARVEAVYPFAPVLLGIPVSIALLSYGSTYCVGIDADPAAIPDTANLRADLETSMAELEYYARQRRTHSPRRRRPPGPAQAERAKRASRSR